MMVNLGHWYQVHQLTPKADHSQRLENSWSSNFELNDPAYDHRSNCLRRLRHVSRHYLDFTGFILNSFCQQRENDSQQLSTQRDD